MLTLRHAIPSLAVLILASPGPLRAGDDTSLLTPKREFRAVWLTTAAGLDWPRTTNPAEQQAALRAIVRTLRQQNFNAIFFQVRARGDAYYRSSLEPWAENLTGTLGRDPGWDPLQFLLDEARESGLEVHAWFNVYKIRGPNAVPLTTPLHVSRLHPSWTVPAEGELWLDPGIPEVRRYVLTVALDLVERYDLDGINFDFLRYPGRAFPDDETYRRFGNGAGRDEWRRGNLTAFLAEFHASALSRHPRLKVGSSPFGVYEADPVSGTSGSPVSVYQDSEEWLRRGIQDYLSPQMYWDIGASRGDPDFAGLAERWQRGSFGRHIYAGIAAYKTEVASQIPRQIDVARGAGNQGQVYFRYGNLQPMTILGNRYGAPALPPTMPWKDSIPPEPPARLAVAEVVTNVFQLEWTAPPMARDNEAASRYVIYRSSPAEPRTDHPANIVAVIPANRTYHLDTVRVPTGLTYQYAVTALDRLSNESPPSSTGTAVVRELIALKGRLSDFTSLSASLDGRSGQPLLLGYRLAYRTTVSLEILRVDTSGTEYAMARPVDGIRDQGTYILGLRSLQLRPGNYSVRLRAGATHLEQPLRIHP
jgi:uncharacterized lipoprotein YddW (UPF0748 family)